MKTMNAKSIDGVPSSKPSKETFQSASSCTGPIRSLGVGLMMAGAAAVAQATDKTVSVTEAVNLSAPSSQTWDRIKEFPKRMRRWSASQYLSLRQRKGACGDRPGLRATLAAARSVLLRSILRAHRHVDADLRSHPTNRGSGASGPIIRNASSISRQVFERAETVEMVNWDLRHSFRFGQPQIHRDAPSPFFGCLKRSPIRHAAALGTEVKLNRVATNVCLGRTRNVDTFAFIVIGPQHPVPTTHGAIARRCRLGDSAESPVHCAAVAGAFDHLRHRLVSFHYE